MWTKWMLKHEGKGIEVYFKSPMSGFSPSVCQNVEATERSKTNGQVEVFNRFIKDNTIRKYKYISKEQLLNHLDNLLIAYNFAKRLKLLKYITPYQKVLEIYNDKNLNNNNRLFRTEPVNQLMGLNRRSANWIKWMLVVKEFLENIKTIECTIRKNKK